MKSVVKYFVFCVSLAVSVVSYSADESACDAFWNSSDDKEVFLLEIADPIVFEALTRDELIDIWGIEENVELMVDNSGGETIFLEGDIITATSSGEVIFQSSVNEYLGSINNLEQDFNQYGYSIRSSGEFNWVNIDDSNDFWRDSQDLDSLYDQILDALKVKAQEKTGECQITVLDPGLCPSINMDNVLTIDGVYSGKKLDLPDGTYITIDSLVDSVNNAAKLSCAKGSFFFNPSNLFTYDYEPDEDTNIGFYVGSKGEIIEGADRVWVEWDSSIKLEEFIAELVYLVDLADKTDNGGDSLLSPFLIQAKQGLMLMLDYSEELSDYADNLEEASMEALDSLMLKYPETSETIVDAVEYIRSRPSVPSVAEPTPPKLTLKKRKDWSGLNFGDTDLLGTEGLAWYELRGSETAHSAQAFAEVKGYIFGFDLQLVGASGDFNVSDESVGALINTKFFGMTWELGDENESGTNTGYRKDLTILEGKDEKVFYDLQWGHPLAWPIGPILVIVELGAKAEVGMRYHYALTPLSITGEVGPYANASGYAEAQASIIIASIGAEADITIVEAYIPLTGRVGAKFASGGEPYLALDIDATARYSALNGKVSAYVKYYVPRFGIPPWKKKTSSKTLFEWDGIKAEHKIMSWGLTYGYNGVEQAGEILDQTDLEHYEALNSEVLLVNRAVELINYQNTMVDKYNSSLTAIAEDINDNLGLTVSSDIISDAHRTLNSNIQTYTQDLDNMANSL